ncbi:MAG: sigma-70 family RNA polymerase sigma factor [Anaerolineae bacterium]|nr:sigma-70 family RNA polymerase sigma factor [Anaerolineae bacterium]
MLSSTLIAEDISSAHLSASVPEVDEERWLAALRQGDETAFGRLVERHHGAMIRLAMGYVPDRAVAEEVVQETWLGVLQGLDRFEGRSSLKTWIYRILINTAKTRGVREGRTIPFSALENPDEEGAEPAVEADRFKPSNHHWASPPDSWTDLDDRLHSQATRQVIDQVISQLPPAQRQVISLRDIQGWSAEEVCQLLSVSETNQRVLLHRARCKVRRALEDYLALA